MFGPEYTKINTAFKRDDRGLIIPGEWATPEIAYLAECDWRWTEKVDGTNIRIHWDGAQVLIGGRTDNAQVPTFLIAALQFLQDGRVADAFAEFDVSDATIYGEGYGPKIQKGGNYRDDVSVIVFDVRVGDWWLRPPDVADVAYKLGLETVPEVGVYSLTRAVEYVREGAAEPASGLAGLRSGVAALRGKEFYGAEGVVGRPLVDLFDRRGDRILTKLKVKDFRSLARRGNR